MVEQNSFLYYDGAKREATSDRYFDNINPATGKLTHTIRSASADDVEAAVRSAASGFQVWSAMSPTERGRILRKAAEILRSRNEEIAKIEVEDTGKPLSEAISVDIHSGADALEYYGGIAASLHGEHYDLGGSFAYTRREPLGICAGIGAWNYPVQIACWKSAPALACGNAMIFKPAELTPRSAVLLAEVFTEAGLPDGVFNVVQGEAEVGQMLTRHPKIRKVSLTGEVGTGKKVMADAAATLKHVTLELGGKSPLIIFDDADLDEAVNGAMLANFYTQGEICSNGTRVYVAESVKASFLEKLVAKTKQLKLGDPIEMDTQVGALISEGHLKKVLNYIEQGKKEAKLIIGGDRRTDVEGCYGGYFVTPAIFEANEESASIVQEEIFGPVMTVLTFKEEKEVVQRANDTIYGLAAGVFTRDLARAHRVVHQLEAGMCWINNYNITPVEIPFGPYKQSGMGKENGLATLNAYSQLKTIYVEMDKIDSPY
ncbi:NAD/NADP-dependent betaine aldehyde dehydrogenase [Arenibacter antarcticus]|uniref:Betaine-aldehyde dehydrogenase n=1 Tax=Arenibacter antarcticus TaxID=2040469 RepID=A0ABW5VGJ3_9FLAO|nr:betaine-aldehyde dehydrogenase [Arenibacter sp. H213]MCM4167099.1 betaine-aldehyde dehydrogenase [Arenibacter sp. H213]